MTQENWQYFNPVRVVYAPGATSSLATHIDAKRIVLVTSPGFTKRGVVDRIRQALGTRLIEVLDNVKPNPDVADVDKQADALRGLSPDCLLALGGGSSMDTAKALAKLLVQEPVAPLRTYFTGERAFEERAALPVVTIPTTSGTGAEVTPFGTVWDFENRKKYSVSGADLYSKVAILDPELTAGLPEEVTVSSGLDAISHALESAWNRNANPVTLGFVAKSLQLSLPALPKLKQKPDDIAARGAMMQASLLAGLAISQTRTALAHSISYPLTTAFNLPHGIACSFSLPALMEFNASADDGRLRDLARAVGHENISAFAAALRELFHQLDVAGLFARYVPDANAVLELTGSMFTPGRADNNLRTVEIGDVRAVLAEALKDMYRQPSAK